MDEQWDLHAARTGTHLGIWKGGGYFVIRGRHSGGGRRTYALRQATILLYTWCSAPPRPSGRCALRSSTPWRPASGALHAHAHRLRWHRLCDNIWILDAGGTRKNAGRGQRFLHAAIFGRMIAAPRGYRQTFLVAAVQLNSDIHRADRCYFIHRRTRRAHGVAGAPYLGLRFVSCGDLAAAG